MDIILHVRCPYRAGNCAGTRKRCHDRVGNDRSGDFGCLLKLIAWSG